MKKTVKQKADDAEREILEPRSEPPTRDEDLLGTGSTMLNLALSGRPHGGLKKGVGILFIGRPQSGKTWSAFNSLAEAAYDSRFKDYRLIYDDVEKGAHMDVMKYFGKLQGKLEPPGGTRKKPQHSRTVEEFYDFLDDHNDSERPFIYVLDSMDGLATEKALKRANENKKARRADKEVTESYGMEKAKVNSERLRVAINRMDAAGSILIVICQTRDNVGIGSLYKPDKHGGGNALEFFARSAVWFKPVGEVKNRARGHEVVVGSRIEAKVTKNSINGWKGKVYFDCIRDVGIDDVGSVIDYLLEWKHWKVKDGLIAAAELGEAVTRAELLHQIEQENQEGLLRDIAAKVWGEVESELQTPRKRRYG